MRIVQSQCPPVTTIRASLEMAKSLGEMARSGWNGAAIDRLNLQEKVKHCCKRQEKAPYKTKCYERISSHLP